MTIINEEREMIRLQVARHLGWRRLEYNAGGMLVGWPPGKRVVRTVPLYTDDIKAVWQIVECLTTIGGRRSLWRSNAARIKLAVVHLFERRLNRRTGGNKP